MLAYIAWRREHCPSCFQHRSEWFGEDGVELKDPPFEVIDVICPSCELLQEHQEEAAADKGRRKGQHPAFGRLEGD